MMVDNFLFLLALGSKMLYVFTYICMLNSSSHKQKKEKKKELHLLIKIIYIHL